MEELEKVLVEHGIRPTANRLLIYRFLKNQEAALALNDIEENFGPSDRTTLYRTMKTFEKKGLVHQIDDGTGAQKYALHPAKDESGNIHLHFHCNNCQETVCLTNHIIPKINLPKGYKADEMNLIIKGLCDKCNEIAHF